jgi:hypothetical protein
VTLASRLHWRLLIGTLAVLMAAAWLAPRFVRPPDIQENRILAPKPDWPRRLQDIRAFRKAADAYVADHFPARPHLIGALNRLRMLAGVSGSSRVIVGRDGWLFFDDDTHLGAARGDPPMSPPEMRDWLRTLAGRTEMLQARGILYLLVSPPSKETVYPQHAPWWFQGPSPRRPAILLPQLAREAGAGEVLYLHPELAEATRRSEKTFSRHDTHWTSYGAYAGYVGLMNRLHALGLTEAPRPLSDFQKRDLGRRGPRDLALMLGVSSFVDLDYPHFEEPPGMVSTRVSYLSAKQDWTGPQVIDTDQPGKPVLLMTRDSFSNELLPFLLPHFSRLILAHNQDGFWRPDLIERFMPDIVIMEVIEPGLRVALGEGPAPSAQASARIDRALAALAPRKAQPPAFGPANAAARAAEASAAPAERCNFDVATMKSAKPAETALTIAGWIWDNAHGDDRSPGFARLQGAGVDYVIPLAVDRSRPDVANAFHRPSARRTGFEGSFVLKALPPGAYTATVYRRSDDRWIVCRARQPLSAP